MEGHGDWEAVEDREEDGTTRDRSNGQLRSLHLDLEVMCPGEGLQK